MKAEEAIVLVGGLGTRLRGVVSDLPKPLAPVAGRPFLAWVLDHLAETGMRRVILAAGYLADKVEQAIGGHWQGMTVSYSIEARALGTGGAVRQACAQLHGDTAHILNGDTFLRYRPGALASAVVSAGARIGIALAQVPDVARYGAVDCEQGRVRAFREKGQSGAGYINAGCYFLTAAAIAALPAEESYSLETEVLTPMAAAGGLVGFAETSHFIDIGVPEDYQRAQALFGAAA